MSKIDYLIKVERENRRPCIIDGTRKAIFHGWDYQHRMGIVEYENGEVEPVFVKQIIFLDSKCLFDEYCWDDANAE